MPVKLISPYRSRERILAYGNEGTGKTEALLSCIRYSGSKGYILENDNAWERVEDYLDESVAERIVRTHVPQNDWTAHVEVMAKYRSLVEPDDWFGIDMTTALYPAVQRHFSERVHGKTIDDLFLAIQEQARKYRANKDEGEKDDTWGGFTGKEWNTITTIFVEEFLTPIVNWPCHVFLCAESDEVKTSKPGSQVKEDKDIKTTYGKIGYKPKGQKRVGHTAQTVLFMSKLSAGEYYMQPIKDRMREGLWVEKQGGLGRIEVGEFAKTYLSGIAGWKWVKA